MATLLALAVIVGTAYFISIAFHHKFEEVIPCVTLTIIAVLYLFYCTDELYLGRIVVYILAAATVLLSIFTLLKKKKQIIRIAVNGVTPGICIFGVICAFLYLYTRGNLVGLWDEMRLWGAVPKILLETETLQLGPDALVFPAMQSYPPGMPLFVYFMMAFNTQFVEYQIFFAYAIFAMIMLLPMLQNLRWRQWLLFVPMALLMVCTPCIFTSHGGDNGQFYLSLFIDPVLGLLTGYVFYLSAKKPFETGFSAFRFSIALLVLTIIKDSGTAFAIFAALNATILFFAERGLKKAWYRYIFTPLSTVVPIGIGYIVWKNLLKVYGIASNEQNFGLKLPTKDALVSFWEKIKTLPMVVMEGGMLSTEITLTFLPCLIILLAVSLLGFTRKKNIGKGPLLITWTAMLFSFAVFCFGYIMVFGAGLPSFQRYVSTAILCAAAFVLLQGIPDIPETFGQLQLKPFSWKRLGAVVLVFSLMCSACLSLRAWKDKKYDMTYSIPAANLAKKTVLAKIPAEQKGNADIYVLIGEKPRAKSLIHHRIYFELIGTQGQVRNFWNDVNIVGGESTPEEWTAEDTAQTAAGFASKLISQGYEYVYIALITPYASEVLHYLGVEEANAGDLFAIQQIEGTVTLIKK